MTGFGNRSESNNIEYRTIKLGNLTKQKKKFLLWPTFFVYQTQIERRDRTIGGVNHHAICLPINHSPNLYC